ncbi:MAG TPA: STN domain-containing protein [Burkholderiaceae bacterium]|nr:STN domain-containing protein [Burkholderiaceae bacterium]
MPKTASLPSRAASHLLILGLAALRGAGAEEPPADLHDFDIPAGPLGSTLLAIGRNAGALVSFRPRIVDTHKAPAVRGRYTLKQALQMALEPSGLTFQITPSGVVTIVDGHHSSP